MLSHRLPALFDAASSYLPDRYLTDPRQASSLHGFGGGTHRCLGEPFARLLTHAAVTRLLQHYDMSLADPDRAPSEPPPSRARGPLQDPLPVKSTLGLSAPVCVSAPGPVKGRGFSDCLSGGTGFEVNLSGAGPVNMVAGGTTFSTALEVGATVLECYYGTKQP